MEKGDKTYEEIEKLLLEKYSSSSKRSYLSPKDMALLMIKATADRMDKSKRDNEVIFTSY